MTPDSELRAKAIKEALRLAAEQFLRYAEYHQRQVDIMKANQPTEMLSREDWLFDLSKREARVKHNQEMVDICLGALRL